MPELAEVEFYRRQWDPGIGGRVEAVWLHGGARPFRDTDTRALRRALTGAVLSGSRAAGKQMLFEFSGGAWLGVHLGMTGNLEARPAEFSSGKHDHLVVRQRDRTLVFHDPRQFGRVRFDRGPAVPGWWQAQAPAIASRAFTVAAVAAFFERRRKLPVKAALLLQERFPGVGNWMADEILWRAGVNPWTQAGRMNGGEIGRVWRMTRFVCRGALRSVGVHGGDPPRGWLFHERWAKGGVCPKDSRPLTYETIGGRTTAWCRGCQGAGVGGRLTGR